jgi:hypothetical protein
MGLRLEGGLGSLSSILTPVQNNCIESAGKGRKSDSWRQAQTWTRTYTLTLIPLLHLSHTPRPQTKIFHYTPTPSHRGSPFHTPLATPIPPRRVALVL